MFGHSAWDLNAIRAAESRSVARKAEEFTGVERRPIIGAIFDCQVSEWSEWKLMDDGCVEIRTRTITQQPACGGRECPPLEEKRDVGATDSVWGWSDWERDPQDPCFEIRRRIQISPAICGGNPNDPLAQ